MKKLSLLLNLLDLGFIKAIKWSTDPCGIPIVSIINTKIRVEYEPSTLKRIIDSSKLDYNDVKNLFFFPSGRWDIETSSGVLIKLPIENIEKSLELSLNLLDFKESDNIKSIDTRPQNQVIIYEWETKIWNLFIYR